MLPLVVSFTRKHWRKLAVVAFVALAFILGRASVPQPEVTLDERTKVAEQARTVEHVKTDEVKTATATTEATKTETVIVYRDRIVTPDRTEHTREVEVRSTDTHVHEQIAAEARKVEVREVKVEVERIVEREVKVEVKPHVPQWRVGVLAGMDMRDARPVQLAPGTVAVGVVVERRIIGGLSVGAWGLHRLDSGSAWPIVGAAVTYEF